MVHEDTPQEHTQHHLEQLIEKISISWDVAWMTTRENAEKDRKNYQDINGGVKLSNQDIKYVGIKEFRESGYLQELNRSFLHPLGFALEILIDDKGNETLGGIWDYRDDPEGMSYAETFSQSQTALKKAEFVRSAFDKKAHVRIKQLGYVIQPIHGIE